MSAVEVSPTTAQEQPLIGGLQFARWAYDWWSSSSLRGDAMITRHSVFLADGIDLHVEHPLGRVQATTTLTDRLAQVGVSDQVRRFADAEGLLK
jgi:hypothetical protein